MTVVNPDGRAAKTNSDVHNTGISSVRRSLVYTEFSMLGVWVVEVAGLVCTKPLPLDLPGT